MTDIPEGFIPHDGGDCPVEPGQFVELLIVTDEGLGSSGVCRARLHEWNDNMHEGGLGRVAHYRLAHAGEYSLIDPWARF